MCGIFGYVGERSDSAQIILEGLVKVELPSSSIALGYTVRRLMGIPSEKAHGPLRPSLSKDSTEKEVDYLVKILPGIIEKLRQMSPIK